MKTARLVIFVGALVLLLGAVMHTIGYRFVMPEFRASNLNPGLLKVVEALWFMFSAIFVLLCPILIWLSRLPGTRGLILLCAVVPLFACILLFWSVGIFAGSVGFAVGTALIIAGGWMMPGTAQSSPANNAGVTAGSARVG